MYKYPLLIIKGFIIGIAKIIPGVSGSLIALTLGLYERLIDSISNFFKDIKYNSIFLLNVGIGFVFAIIFGSNILILLLQNLYYITMMFFIGILIGSIKTFYKNIRFKSVKEFIIFLIFFFLMLLFFFYKKEGVSSYSMNNYLYLSIIGFIDAFTMIIPGISGTATFMLIGCYDMYLKIFSNILVYYKQVFFIIFGIMTGVIILSKIIFYLINKKQKFFYPMIFGFSLSSIFILFFNTIDRYSNYIEGLIGLILLFIGYKISKKFSY